MMVDQTLLFQAAAWAAGILVVYAFFSRGLFLAAAPLRKLALEEAVVLEASDELREDDRLMVLSMLDDLHSPARAWRIALKTLRMAFIFRASKEAREVYAPELQTKLDALTVYWIVGTITNSFAAVIVFVFAWSLFAAFHASSLLLSALLGRDLRNGDQERRLRA